MATHLASNTTQTFPWYASIDEDTFTAISSNTLSLEPGLYDFSLVLTRVDHQYLGNLSNVSVYDGENDILFTLHPVIGEAGTDIILSQVASLEFQYPAIELSAISDPRLGYVIDSGSEVVLAINKTTGLSVSYVKYNRSQDSRVLGNRVHWAGFPGKFPGALFCSDFVVFCIFSLKTLHEFIGFIIFIKENKWFSGISDCSGFQFPLIT